MCLSGQCLRKPLPRQVSPSRARFSLSVCHSLNTIFLFLFFLSPFFACALSRSHALTLSLVRSLSLIPKGRHRKGVNYLAIFINWVINRNAQILYSMRIESYPVSLWLRSALIKKSGLRTYPTPLLGYPPRNSNSSRAMGKKSWRDEE